LRILAIETSCDETGVAVVDDGRRIVSNIVASQLAHQDTGGIVPEVAAREHLRALDGITQHALQEAGVELRAVDAVAATVGPGLVGCLLVGANYGRGLALAAGLPFIGVNHLEGHVYANWLYEGDTPTPEPEIPAVVLIVSGAHSDLVLMEGHRRFRPLGRTIDDAAGEAFDKVARLLGLGFPGGPAIEQVAVGARERQHARPDALESGALRSYPLLNKLWRRELLVSENVVYRRIRLASDFVPREGPIRFRTPDLHLSQKMCGFGLKS